MYRFIIQGSKKYLLVVGFLLISYSYFLSSFRNAQSFEQLKNCYSLTIIIQVYLRVQGLIVSQSFFVLHLQDIEFLELVNKFSVLSGQVDAISLGLLSELISR